jgi:hypothetical protein
VSILAGSSDGERTLGGLPGQCKIDGRAEVRAMDENDGSGLEIRDGTPAGGTALM